MPNKKRGNNKKRSTKTMAERDEDAQMRRHLKFMADMKKLGLTEMQNFEHLPTFKPIGSFGKTKFIPNPVEEELRPLAIENDIENIEI